MNGGLFRCFSLMKLMSLSSKLWLADFLLWCHRNNTAELGVILIGCRLAEGPSHWSKPHGERSTSGLRRNDFSYLFLSFHLHPSFYHLSWSSFFFRLSIYFHSFILFLPICFQPFFLFLFPQCISICPSVLPLSSQLSLFSPTCLFPSLHRRFPNILIFLLSSTSVCFHSSFLLFSESLLQTGNISNLEGSSEFPPAESFSYSRGIGSYRLTAGVWSSLCWFHTVLYRITTRTEPDQNSAKTIIHERKR